MAKKGTTKKTTTKRTTTRKKVTEPVVEPVVEVVEKVTEETEAIDDLAQAEEAEMVEMPNVEAEAMPEDDALFQEQVLRHVASEILVEKNNSLNDFVSTPKEEMVEKAKEKIEEIKKINNQKVNDRIDQLFGYLWNGQEMDY
jgi:hypothetical protein